MGRIIVNNESSLSDTEAMQCVLGVMTYRGVHYGDRYCLRSQFRLPRSRRLYCEVIYHRNAKSDAFTVLDPEQTDVKTGRET